MNLKIMSLFSTHCTGVVQKFVLLETFGDNNQKISYMGKGEVLKKCAPTVTDVFFIVSNVYVLFFKFSLILS